MTIPVMGVNSINSLERMASANDTYKQVAISYACAYDFEKVSCRIRDELSWKDAIRHIRGMVGKRKEAYIIGELNAFIEQKEYIWVQLEEWKQEDEDPEFRLCRSCYVEVIEDMDIPSTYLVGPFKSPREATTFITQTQEINIAHGWEFQLKFFISPDKIVEIMAHARDSDSDTSNQGDS